VINQGLYYLDWLLDHQDSFFVLVQNKLGSKEASLIDWSMPCVICIASDFTKYDEHAVNQMRRNIKLVRYKKYNNTHLIFELLTAPQVSPLEINEKDMKPEKPSPTSDVTFKKSYEKAPDTMKKLYDELRNYIVSLGDDISESELKHYVAFRKVKNFTCVEIHNKRLIVQLQLDPDTVKLEPGFMEDYSKKGHWGTGNLRVIIKTPGDFKKAKPFIAQAYNEN
jgi:predicted transport protein